MFSMMSVNYLFNFRCFFSLYCVFIKKHNFGVQVMFFYTNNRIACIVLYNAALPVQCYIIPHYLYICNDVYITIFHGQIFVNNVQYDFSQLFI